MTLSWYMRACGTMDAGAAMRGVDAMTGRDAMAARDVDAAALRASMEVALRSMTTEY